MLKKGCWRKDEESCQILKQEEGKHSAFKAAVSVLGAASSSSLWGAIEVKNEAEKKEVLSIDVNVVKKNIKKRELSDCYSNLNLESPGIEGIVVIGFVLSSEQNLPIEVRATKNTTESKSLKDV